MRNRVGILTIVAAAFLGWGPGAFAADEMMGVEAVRGKNTRTKTVQLGERTFRIDDESVLRDAGGERIRLSDLGVPDLGRGDSDPMLGSLVARYSAVRRGGRLILRTLEIEPNVE